MRKNTLTLLAVVSSAVLLAACSGGGNSLSDPSDEEETTISLCGTGETCITGRLEDGQVAGINYTCGAVTSVTNANGEFVCAVGSTIQFSIKDDSLPYVVTLGDAVVPDTLANAALLPRGPDGLPLRRVYITALDIANAASPSVPEAAAARNVTRLLHALNTSTSIAGTLSPKDDPSRDIVLSTDVKKQFLEALGESVDVSLMNDAAFESKMTVPLGTMAPPRVLISVDEANGLLLKAKYSINAGAYLDGGFIVSSDTRFDLIGFGAVISLFYGYNSSEELFGEATVTIDRKGRLFGAGSASVGARNIQVRMVRYDPVQFYVRPGMKLGLDGAVAGMVFDLDNGDSFSMKTGIIDRNVMAPSLETYKNAFGADNVPSDVSSRIGTLDNGDVVNPYTSSGVFLQRPTNVVTTLDPAVWSAVTFPLHVTATLKEDEDGAVLGTIKFSILSDGNIVTDLDGDCAGVNLDSLNDGNIQERPIGVIARAIQIDSRKYIEPLLILPKTIEYGSQIAGAFVGGLSPVRLRVDSGAGTDYLKIFANPPGGSDDEVAGAAAWVSKFRTYKAIYEERTLGSSSIVAAGVFETAPTVCSP